MAPEKLLDSVKLTGEGRGRLSFGKSQNQYVFGVESVLKENADWILAVAVPLHGEEVMIFPNLKRKEIEDDTIDAFEDRIQREFKKLKLSKLSGTEFLAELRSLIRFHLAKPLGIERNCKVQQGQGDCSFDGEKYKFLLLQKELKIIKSLSGGETLQLSAHNLTDSFFVKTHIRLYETPQDIEQDLPALSLELFW